MHSPLLPQDKARLLPTPSFHLAVSSGSLSSVQAFRLRGRSLTHGEPGLFSLDCA